MSGNPESREAGTGRFFLVAWIGLAVVTLIAALAVVTVRGQAVRSQTDLLEQQAAQGQPVLVTTLVGRPETREISLPGEIHGYIETPVYAKIPGYMKAIYVDKGDRVKKGQVLALLSSPETDRQVDYAKADLRIKTLTNRRYQDMVKYDAASQQQADQTLADMLQAQATLRQLRAMQQYEEIRADFDGRVTARNMDPGALITQTTASTGSTPTPVVTMATLSPLRVYLYLPQPFAPLVRDGDAAVVTVSEYPKRDFVGTVTRHPAALDQSTRTMQVEVDLPNADLALYPGMYANVRVSIGGAKQSPRVPDEALIFNNEDVLVPVVRDNRIHLVKVELGLDDGINCEVISGLEGDETIALGMGQTAHDGELVQPVSSKKD